MLIGARLGAYAIKSELGSGGMGRVYLAENGRRVAIKVLHPHLLESTEAVERFKREAEIGQRVRHDNVVRTLDVGSAVVGNVTHHYLVMDYVEGQTLRGLLGELGRVSEELCRHIGREIAKGLAAIHAEAVVHRDLKPENVLITKDHVVKVMDLGVARLQDAVLTLSKTGGFLGSVLYAAPEQFGGDVPDARADFYALGLILYELATGKHPFKADSFADVVYGQTQQDARPAAELNPQLSPFYEELCKALLEKDRAQRLTFLPADEESAWWRERAQAIRRKTRRPLRRVRIPRETALYGRDDDLARLAALYESAKRGEGRVLLLEGEAGVGKTRLVDEFMGRLQKRDEDLDVLFGSYATKRAAAFATAYHAQFGDAGAADYLPLMPALVPAFDALLRGEPTPLDVRPLSEESLQACFVQATRALAAQRPTVVLIDDLHFASRESLALFQALAVAIRNHRVLLVGTTRPGLDEEWLANVKQLDQAEHAELARLGAEDLMHLLEDLLHSGRVAEKLGHQIATKSDGNPFFVFEIVRGLRDERFITQLADGSWTMSKDLDDIHIPSSVLDLIQARIDDLDDAERKLLDVASCCGFEFDPRLVADALAMRRIPALRRFGHVERAHRLVRSSGRHLVFDHHQVQQALYDGLDEARRAEYHAALGEALERRGGAAVSLCDHFLRGGLGDRARPYLAAALDTLEQAHANDAAIDLADRALAVEGLLAGTERVAILERKAARLDLVGRWQEEEAVLLEARDHADAVGDPGARNAVRRRLGLLYRSTDRYEEGLAVLGEALEIVRATGDRRTLALITGTMGDVLRRADRYEEARQHFERHLAIAREIGDRPGEMMASGAMGNILAVTGNREEGVEWTRKYLAIAQECGDTRAEAIGSGNLGVDALHMGRFEEAREHLQRSQTLSRQLGYRMGDARAHGNLAVSYDSEGHLAAAIEHAETYLELSSELGYARGRVFARNHLTECYLACGDVAKARGMAEAGLEAARQAGLHAASGAALTAAGAIAEASHDLDLAEARYAEAVALTREAGNVESLLPALLKQGALFAGRARPDEAQAALAEALALARDAHLLGPQAQAAALLATLPGGNPAAAMEFFATNESRLTHAMRMSCRYLFWQATGDGAQLETAHDLLTAARAQAPDEYRDSMIENVPLHRDITQAWAERER